jgi:hypothetical protein
MTKFLELILTNQTLKAWVGAVMATAAFLGSAVSDGVLDGTEIGAAVGVLIATLGLVYRVPNGKASE